MYSFDVAVQCGDVKTAEHLFEQCKIKSVHLYGAMMKGKMFDVIENTHHGGIRFRICEKQSATESIEFI